MYFQDQDLKRAQGGGEKAAKAMVDPRKAKVDEDDNIGKSLVTKKQTLMMNKYNSRNTNSNNNSKYKPGPKSARKKRQQSESEEEEELISFSSESDDDSLPDLSPDEEKPLQRIASKMSDNTKKTKGREVSPDPVNRTNTQYIRKRKPLNLTAADLEEDDDEDDWEDKAKASKRKNDKTVAKAKKASPAAGSRVMPRRNARRKAAEAVAQKEDQFSSED